MKRLSIITVFLNEESNLPLLRQRIDAAVASLPLEVEIILVDDASTDNSENVARQWVVEDPRAQYIRLSRNFGSHTAVAVGLAKCTGDCAVFLAADLQDPPEIIPELVERWQQGYDMVWATRAKREGETRTTLFFAWLYYRIMRAMALKELNATGADFLLLDRKVIDAYNSIHEKNTSTFAMLVWMGFRQTKVEYIKRARHSGVSKWGFSRKIKLTIDSLVSFSYVPIRFMSVTGLLVSFLGFLYGLVVIYRGIFGKPIEGWASLMVVVLFLGGIQLVMLGVLGEYLWRAFDEARGRPRYLIQEHFRHPGPQAEHLTPRSLETAEVSPRVADSR